MLKDYLSDTIAAISTSCGEGGIGIVRLSGKKALAIADKIFISRSGACAANFKSYTLHYGKICVQGQPLDEVLLSVMRKPKSYTREDVVEINCHGGAVVLQKILALALEKGARLAEPGEFTKRAFLNGRIDLAQAEAVIDIIRAKTDSALRLSLSQLSGGLSKEINKIRRGVLDILVSLEAAIDFPEEDLQPKNKQKNLQNLKIISANLEQLLQDSFGGRILREGIQVVICGRPNVGKSSLLNALLKKERSIVTAIAGTTRDTIEELLDIKGIPVKIIDTAGILRARNLIEKQAVLRSHKQITLADLVIILFEANKKLNRHDWKLVKQIKHKKAIAVINKIDLGLKIEKDEIAGVFQKVIELSAKKGKNLKLLEDAIAEFAGQGKLLNPESICVSNLRHIQALKKVLEALKQTKSSWEQNDSLEFVAQSLKDAGVYLDRILGKSFSEDLLEKIFADFCIGK